MITKIINLTKLVSAASDPELPEAPTLTVMMDMGSSQPIWPTETCSVNCG